MQGRRWLLWYLWFSQMPNLKCDNLILIFLKMPVEKVMKWSKKIRWGNQTIQTNLFHTMETMNTMKASWHPIKINKKQRINSKTSRIELKSLRSKRNRRRIKINLIRMHITLLLRWIQFPKKNSHNLITSTNPNRSQLKNS